MTLSKTIYVKAEPLDSTLTHVELVALVDDKSWSSPNGGWLDGTKGSWLQRPQGVILYLDSDGGTKAAGRLIGLDFKAAAFPLNGTFDFTKPQVVVGTWVLEKII